MIENTARHLSSRRAFDRLRAEVCARCAGEYDGELSPVGATPCGKQLTSTQLAEALCCELPEGMPPAPPSEFCRCPSELAAELAHEAMFETERRERYDQLAEQWD